MADDPKVVTPTIYVANGNGKVSWQMVAMAFIGMVGVAIASFIPVYLQVASIKLSVDKTHEAVNSSASKLEVIAEAKEHELKQKAEEILRLTKENATLLEKTTSKTGGR